MSPARKLWQTCSRISKHALSAPRGEAQKSISEWSAHTKTLLGELFGPPSAQHRAALSSAANIAPTGRGSLSLKELVGAYKKLSKFRLSAFVVSTACAGYVLGSGDEVEWSGMGWTALGTLGASACANTLNQIFEVKNDALMGRTMARPLPSGRLSRGHAFAFALIAGGAGVTILATKTNLVTASLGAANIALYAGVYTPLKQITPLNTWVGAVVGAIPPLMGWAASAGDIQPGAWILAAALYFWQIPHFLSLAYLCKEDYAKAGFEMLSKYDPFGRRLASISLRNCLYMFPLGILSVVSGVTTSAFGYEAGVLSVGLALSTTVFHQKPSKALARAAFKASLVFLPLFMLGMLVHRKPNQHDTEWADIRARLREFVFPASLDIDGGSEEGKLGVMQVAPFPFVSVPATLITEQAEKLLWEGLDEVIAEEELKLQKKDRGTQLP